MTGGKTEGVSGVIYITLLYEPAHNQKFLFDFHNSERLPCFATGEQDTQHG